MLDLKDMYQSGPIAFDDDGHMVVYERIGKIPVEIMEQVRVGLH